MEPKFKTSFIPKQALTKVEEGRMASTKEHRLPAGPFTIVTFVILVGAVSIAAGLYFYSSFLQQNIQSKTTMLQKARDAFQPALIKELERLDTRINSAQVIVDQHVAPSYLFTLLEQTTLKTVQFQNFSYERGVDGLTLKMSGRAASFASVALQSDVFGSNQFVREPYISNIKVAPDGSVLFDVTARIDPRLISYTTEFSANQQPGANAQPPGPSAQELQSQQSQ